MQIVRYLLKVAISIVCIQAVYTFAIWGYARRDGTVDVARSQETIFQTEAKTAVYKIPLIAELAQAQQVVVLGASNANLALRPEELSPLLHNVKVHNLAIGGQNMRSLRQLVDLIYRIVPKSEQSNLVFVIGIWYGSFVDDARRWPEGVTDIDRELLRFGLFQKSPTGELYPTLPNRLLRPAMVSTWPLMVPEAAYVSAARILVPKKLRIGVPVAWYPPVKVRNSIVINKEQKVDQMAGYSAYLGPIDEQTDAGFQQLIELATLISNANGKLMVLDLPLPAWHSDESVISHLYDQRKLPYFAELQKLVNVQYQSMQGKFGEEDFFDGVHPKPRTSPKMARIAAEPINHLLSLEQPLIR